MVVAKLSDVLLAVDMRALMMLKRCRARPMMTWPCGTS